MLITLIYNSETHKLKLAQNSDEKTNLAQFIFLSGKVPPRPLCAGIGHCGRCKVIFHSVAPDLSPTEKKILNLEEQKQNIRLACRHHVQEGMAIELMPDSYSHENKPSKEIKKPLAHTVKNRLFIDIGTTSIAWQCQPIEKSAYTKDEFENLTLAGQSLNPQMVAGADIMARLYTAKNLSQNENPERTYLLKELIYKHIKEICDELINNNLHIEDIFIAANPSIMALSLGTDISGLCSAPYILSDMGNRYTKLYDLPKIWIAPQMSPFIGADACAGLAYIISQTILDSVHATDHHAEKTTGLELEKTREKTQSIKHEEESFLLADMGTNGEFIFYKGKNTVLGASVPLGPAIEGVGMRCGGPVHGTGEHTILSFSLGIHGLEYVCTGTPKFICGAGYLSLIHILLSINILNREGFFQESSSPLASKITKRIRIENDEKRLYITDDIYICSEDIENILKVKSAFSTALQLLTKDQKPKTLYLSGALSEHIPLSHMENLGFIPQGASKFTKILGNSSLKGLIQLSYSKTLCDEITSIAQNAHVLDLTADPLFSDIFIENMHF